METVAREPQLADESGDASLLTKSAAREADELCGEALTLVSEACSNCAAGVLAIGGTAVRAARAAFLCCRAAFLLATTVEHAWKAIVSLFVCHLPANSVLEECAHQPIELGMLASPLLLR